MQSSLWLVSKTTPLLPLTAVQLLTAIPPTATQLPTSVVPTAAQLPTLIPIAAQLPTPEQGGPLTVILEMDNLPPLDSPSPTGMSTAKVIEEIGWEIVVFWLHWLCHALF